MVIYNALPRKEYERVFMCKTAKEIWKTLYVVPTGRVKVPDDRYVVPTNKDNVIVSAGRTKVIPAGRTILVLNEVVTVGIKSLLKAISITAALIDVNASQSKLVLLENLNENYSKYLRLLYKVNTAEGVNAASEEVSTAELLKEFDLLKWDQQMVSELVALRNFARRHGSRFCIHDSCIQSSHAQTG
ncbi:hypothetical protein Tco_0613450 [Tanacetum coccineum]